MYLLLPSLFSVSVSVSVSVSATMIVIPPVMMVIISILLKQCQGTGNVKVQALLQRFPLKGDAIINIVVNASFFK